MASSIVNACGASFLPSPLRKITLSFQTLIPLGWRRVILPGTNSVLPSKVQPDRRWNDTVMSSSAMNTLSRMVMLRVMWLWVGMRHAHAPRCAR